MAISFPAQALTLSGSKGYYLIQYDDVNIYCVESQPVYLAPLGREKSI